MEDIQLDQMAQIVLKHLLTRERRILKMQQEMQILLTHLLMIQLEAIHLNLSYMLILMVLRRRKYLLIRLVMVHIHLINLQAVRLQQVPHLLQMALIPLVILKLMVFHGEHISSFRQFLLMVILRLLRLHLQYPRQRLDVKLVE